MKIYKRDGRLVPFDQNKIIDAVLSAFEDVDGKITSYAEIKAGNIADYIQEIAETKELTIEEIQDLVEKGLMATKRKDVAKSFILYRENRTRERNKQSPLTRQVKRHIMADNVKNQNANVDENSFGGRRGEASGAVMKDYALNYCMSKKAVRNHLDNIIYTHDLDSYAVGMHNCLTLPVDDIMKGFNTRQTDVRCANSINTFFQLLAVAFQLQSLQQFGGVSASHLDWSAVPYIRKSFYKHWLEGMKYIEGIEEFKDKELLTLSKDSPINSEVYKEYFPDVYKYAMDMTEKETQQAVEGMYHNLNTLQSRSGN